LSAELILNAIGETAAAIVKTLVMTHIVVLVFALEVLLQYFGGMICRTMFAVEVVLFIEKLRAVLEAE
jgi:hypothetical protein